MSAKDQSIVSNDSGNIGIEEVPVNFIMDNGTYVNEDSSEQEAGVITAKLNAAGLL